MSLATSYEKITDDKEKEHFLFQKMVNAGAKTSFPANTKEICEKLRKCFISLNTKWTKINRENGLPDEWAEKYEEEYGVWNHSAGRTKKHNKIGMKWGYQMKKREESENDPLENFLLDDSPDFSFSINHPKKRKNIYCAGDIGRCTPTAVTYGCLGAAFEPGSLWISVLSENTEIVVEFEYSMFELHEETDGHI
jgi:hypothetical protein